ncbi:MAG: hypothetical protein EXQ84_06115 [Rhodospirillaceae bacterium]|nr:hypothetical protein [Rhodospirillaceae bacterium]
MKIKKTFAAALLAGTAMTAVPAMAADATADLARQIQMLQDQLRSVQQQLEALKAAGSAQKDDLAKETAAREASEKAARDAALAAGGTLIFTDGKAQVVPPANPKVVESAAHVLTLSSADNAWTIQPTGRIHFDMGAYLAQKPDGTTGPLTATAGNGKLTSGINVRRARFGVTGKANDVFTYSLIFDLGGSPDSTTPLINTASIGYTGIANTILEAGYFAHFFTLEESISSNNVLFIERSTPATITSSVNSGDPRSGVGFRTWDTNWWFGAYLTGSAPGDAHALNKRRLGAYQRLTYNPIQDAAALQSLHFGIGAAQLFDVPDTGELTAATITLSDRPELRIDTTNSWLNTGALGTVANPVTSVQVYSAETAAAFGSFFYMGEYFKAVVNRRGKTAATFDGAYIAASYTIGGRRTYTANCGCYGGVTPATSFNPLKGGEGAFEFAARISYQDLVDNYTSSLTAASQPNLVNGGRQTNLTFGVNWYWTPNIMWKLNYIHSHFDKAGPIPTATSRVRAPLGLEIDALAARFQVTF